MIYKIIETGSSGNAVIISNEILIDCGSSFKKLEPYYKSIKLILLTHIHHDHLNIRTLKKIKLLKPSIRIGCCEWLVDEVKGLNRVDVFQLNEEYCYGEYVISPFFLQHDVPNCGYKIKFKSGERVVYATDTESIKHIEARDYDLYLIEANHKLEEIKQKIAEKQKKGEFVYEFRAIANHLSFEKCNEFLMKNMGENSVAEYLHMHAEK